MDQLFSKRMKLMIMAAFPAGSQVLKGHFFLRDNLIDMTFKLDLQRVAIVYPGTVRYVCSELRRKGRGRNTVFHVGMAIHEDIIASLSPNDS